MSILQQVVVHEAGVLWQGGTAQVDTTALARDVQTAVADVLARAFAAVSGTKAAAGGAAAAGPGAATGK